MARGVASVCDSPGVTDGAAVTKHPAASSQGIVGKTRGEEEEERGELDIFKNTKLAKLKLIVFDFNRRQMSDDL